MPIHGSWFSLLAKHHQTNYISIINRQVHHYSMYHEGKKILPINCNLPPNIRNTPTSSWTSQSGGQFLFHATVLHSDGQRPLLWSSTSGSSKLTTPRASNHSFTNIFKEPNTEKLEVWYKNLSPPNHSRVISYWHDVSSPPNIQCVFSYKQKPFINRAQPLEPGSEHWRITAA